MSAPFYAEGNYVCEIISQAMTEASTGNPQFVLRFKVLGAPDPKNPDNYLVAPQQYERSCYRTITEKTIDWFIDDLRVLGFTGNSFRDLSSDSPNFCNFKGLTIDMYCKHVPGQNGEREEWNISHPRSNSPEYKQLDSKQVRKLDDLFGKQLRGGMSGNGQAKPTAPTPTQAPSTGSAQHQRATPPQRTPPPPPAADDVPF
jgi:hypothetical protein